MVIQIDVRNKRGSAKDKALSPNERKYLLETIVEPKHRIILILEGLGALRTEEMAQCRFSWLKRTSFNGVEVLAVNIPSQDSDTRDKKKKWYNAQTTINKDTNFNKFKTKVREPRTTYIFELNLIFEVFEWFRNNPDGLQMTRQNISTIIVKNKFRPLIDKLREEEGLNEEEIKKKGLTSHGLRASAINYFYYERNLPMNVIKVIVGHKDERTTQKHYESMNKESVEGFLINYLSQ